MPLTNCNPKVSTAQKRFPCRSSLETWRLGRKCCWKWTNLGKITRLSVSKAKRFGWDLQLRDVKRDSYFSYLFGKKVHATTSKRQQTQVARSVSEESFFHNFGGSRRRCIYVGLKLTVLRLVHCTSPAGLLAYFLLCSSQTFGINQEYDGH